MADTLQEVQLTEAVPLVRKDSAPEHDIDTAYGNLHVTVHGVDKGNRPAIVTYHDIGLNHKTCFDALFADEDMQEIIKHFCIYHIDAPGQYPGAPAFPEGYQYPSMEQLAEMVPTIVYKMYVIHKHILACVRDVLQLHYPSLVEGVVLINIDTSAKGWFDWAASKVTDTPPSPPPPSLSTPLCNNEIAEKQLCNFQVECNSKLDPTKTSLLKVREDLSFPNKLTEAFKYFVQGMGHSKSRNFFIQSCAQNFSRNVKFNETNVKQTY
uniref:Ndrg family member 3b n=1 Tax=Eptatretus burgeri TaxID=7764 RepID=A0A8C4QF49_EPTBU